jgi:DNA ligase-associated metallophosphoesterase
MLKTEALGSQSAVGVASASGRVGVARAEVAGQALELWAQRALGWPAQRTLFIADMHLGKPATFRSAGIPVPEATTHADLTRLGAALDASGAERLIVLGDLVHARAGWCAETIEAVSAWRAARAGLEVVLVRGNHDRGAGDPPPAWKMECVSGPLAEGPFVLAHEPCDDERGHVLCGHLHPAARLVGAGSSSLRAPCFWVSPTRTVLPAFGTFTGAKMVTPRRGDRVFVVGQGVVVQAACAGE